MELLSVNPNISLKMQCMPGLLSLFCNVNKEFWRDFVSTGNRTNEAINPHPIVWAISKYSTSGADLPNHMSATANHSAASVYTS